MVEKQVSPSVYRLHLPQSMSHLWPVFNVVKLLPAPEDPIPRRRPHPSPPPVIVEEAEEYEVEEILDSRLIHGRLKFLIRWKGYGREHDSWESVEDVHAPDCVKDFY